MGTANGTYAGVHGGVHHSYFRGLCDTYEHVRRGVRFRLNHEQNPAQTGLCRSCSVYRPKAHTGFEPVPPP